MLKRKRRRRKNSRARDRQDQSSIEGSTRVSRGPKEGFESIMEWKWAPSGQNFEVADMRTRGELDDEGPHSWNPISSRKHPLASFLHSEAKKLRRLVLKVGTVQISNKIYFHTCWKDIWSMALLYGLWFPILLLIMKALTKVSGRNFPFFVVSHASVSFKLNNPNFYILSFLCPNLKLHFFHSGTLP